MPSLYWLSSQRLITFNRDLHAALQSSTAVDIILTDLAEGVLNLENKKKTGLLRELETESWTNGSRGREKDGRAPHMPCRPVCTDFMSKVKVDVLSIVPPEVKLPKYIVQAHLDHDAVENEKVLQRENELFDHNMDFKSIFDNSDDANLLHPQTWKRQGCDESDNPLYFLKHAVSGLDAEPLPVPEPVVTKVKPALRVTQTSSCPSSPESMLQRRESSLDGILGGSLEDSTQIPTEGANTVTLNKPGHRQKTKVDLLVAAIRKSRREEPIREGNGIEQPSASRSGLQKLYPGVKSEEQREHERQVYAEEARMLNSKSDTILKKYKELGL
jgi:hypothetical protein